VHCDGRLDTGLEQERKAGANSFCSKIVLIFWFYFSSNDKTPSSIYIYFVALYYRLLLSQRCDAR
jgi:hypothetical protein